MHSPYYPPTPSLRDYERKQKFGKGECLTFQQWINVGKIWRANIHSDDYGLFGIAYDNARHALWRAQIAMGLKRI